jgi:hypothetical protein
MDKTATPPAGDSVESLGDVPRAEQVEAIRRHHLFQEHRHPPSAAHAEIVRQVNLEEARRGRLAGEQLARRSDRLPLDGAAPDGALKSSVGQHEKPRARLLWRRAGGRDHRGHHERHTLLDQASNLQE